MANNADRIPSLADRAPTAAISDFLRGSVSISELMQRVWERRWIVLIFLILGIAYGGYTAWRNGPTYAATMTMVPAETDTTGGHSSGALSLLSDLAGGGGGTSVPRMTQFMAALRSNNVAKLLNQKYDMVCRIYRGACDQKTHKWRRATGIRAWLSGELAQLGGFPDPNSARTATDLAQYVEGAVTVGQDSKTHLLTLTYSNSDPEFAVRFLTLLVRTANDYLKDRDRDVMRRYVDYLSQRIASNTSVAQRSALDQLLLEQERKLMLTEVNVPYAAAVLDGPTVLPVNKVLKGLVLFGLLGLVLGILAALACSYLPQYVPPQWRFWSRRWMQS